MSIEKRGDAGPGTMHGLNDRTDNDTLAPGWQRVPTVYEGPGGKRNDEWFSVPPMHLQDGKTRNPGYTRWGNRQALDAGWQLYENLDGSPPEIAPPLVDPRNEQAREQEFHEYFGENGKKAYRYIPGEPTARELIDQLEQRNNGISRNDEVRRPAPTTPETAAPEAITSPQRRRSLGRRVLGRVMRAVRPRR